MVRTLLGIIVTSPGEIDGLDGSGTCAQMTSDSRAVQGSYLSLNLLRMGGSS